MAIAPIQGMLKRGLLVNLSIGIGSGLVGGYSFWYWHQKNVDIRDAYYLNLQEQKKAQGI